MGSDFKIDNRIVFYDGFCVVCSKFINLLIYSDKNKLNKFLGSGPEEAADLCFHT